MHGAAAGGGDGEGGRDVNVEVGMGEKKRFGRRLVLFPSPFEGHINPMFQLANLLHTNGFSITIVHTNFNSPDPSKYPNFHFIAIPDDLPETITSSEDHMAFLIALNANCQEPFRRRMVRLLAEEEGGGEPVVGLIVDAQIYSTRVVAEELKLPRMVLRTSSAASFYTFAAVINDPPETAIPELPALRAGDLPHFNKSTQTSVLDVLTLIVNEARASSAVIMNTFEALEPKELEKLRAELQIPVIPLGPFHKLSYSSFSNSRIPQDCSCIDWLDKQEPMSVLYVSFGSLACMEECEFVEMARGLADSRQPFLWVLRPGSVRGAERPAAALHQEVNGKGKVVEWAPQQEVLRHPAIGGFWTHCGWNSVMESICEGIPMLCSPFFGDQLVNARYVSHVWKVGIRLENELERGAIGRGIRILMVEKEGEEMRERARGLKLDSERSVCEEGGSFHLSLNEFVNQILPM